MLPKQLINDFVRATVVKKEKPSEITHYGKATENGVIFDGATDPVPCTPLVEYNTGDRVMILVKDHSAYISGVIDKGVESQEDSEEGD